MNITNLLKKSFLSFCLLAGTSTLSALDFTLLTDIHVVPGNENQSQLEKAIQEINGNKSEFVILSGDLSNEGSDKELFNVKQVLDKIQKPVYIIPGNHETSWSQSALKTFNDIWDNDRFVFEADSLIFIGINCGPYMKMGDGHIKQEDLIWLDKELSKRCTPGKRVVSVNHYPIQPDLDNWQDYIAILQKYPTIVHICGHYHVFDKYKGGDIDAVKCRALDMKAKGLDYGYTDFSINNDSIFVYNKELGEQPELKYAFKANAEHKPYIRQQDESFAMPENFTIERVYQDYASIFTRLAIDKDKIYFGNSLGEAKAIEKNTGKDIWSLKTNASLFSRMAYNSKYIIVPTADKRIIWADKQTGRVIRENKSEGPYVADGLVSGNYLFQGGFKKFECWNLNTANREWINSDLNNYCQAAPVIDGNDIFFGAWDTYLRCLDKKTGKLKWKWNNGRSANMLGPGNCVPAVTKDRVFVVAPDRYMTVLDRKTGEVIWRSNFDQKYKVRESLGLTADKKYVLAKTMDGELLTVSTSADTPEIAFIVDAKLGYEHIPCIIAERNGIAYLGSRNGILAAVDLKQHTLLWRYRLGTSAFNGFEIDKDGTIYTSLVEGCIWRIRQK